MHIQDLHWPEALWWRQVSYADTNPVNTFRERIQFTPHSWISWNPVGDFEVIAEHDAPITPDPNVAAATITGDENQELAVAAID